MMGIRREWGGSIVFFGQTDNSEMGMNPTNAIDAHDTGREIQVGPYGIRAHMSLTDQCPGVSHCMFGWP